MGEGGTSSRSSDMRILVTGASGFVGTARGRELLARGHRVGAAVGRLVPPSAVPSQLHQILVPDIAAEFDRRALVDGVGTVVHLAAIAHRSSLDDGEMRRVNCDAAVRLAEAAAGSARRFIFLSSVKVHGEDSGSGTYAEDDALDPQDSYGRSKLEAERALTETAARMGIELVIVRPPLVYGPGVKANFLRLLWLGRFGTAPALRERAQPPQPDLRRQSRRRDRAPCRAPRRTRALSGQRRRERFDPRAGVAHRKRAREIRKTSSRAARVSAHGGNDRGPSRRNPAPDGQSRDRLAQSAPPARLATPVHARRGTRTNGALVQVRARLRVFGTR